jgi:hypothetical protein
MGNSAGADVDDAPLRRIRATPWWETAMAVVGGILCGGGILLAGVIFFQYLDVYFTLGAPAVIDDGDSPRYEATASACVAALGASLLLALFARRWELAWVAGVVLVVGLIVAFLFAVPQERWAPADESHPLPTNYEPCYSGSRTCAGGG